MSSKKLPAGVIRSDATLMDGRTIRYYDTETCECNTYDIILDDDGDVIWDNGLLSEPELLMSMEAN